VNVPEAWITTLLGGGLVTGVASFFAGRKTERASIIGDVYGAAKELIADLRQEVRDIRERHATCEERLTAVQAQLDHLMKGPVPPYTIGPPK
jgi:hypothetical protein